VPIAKAMISRSEETSYQAKRDSVVWLKTKVRIRVLPNNGFLFSRLR